MYISFGEEMNKILKSNSSFLHTWGVQVFKMSCFQGRAWSSLYTCLIWSYFLYKVEVSIKDGNLVMFHEKKFQKTSNSLFKKCDSLAPKGLNAI